MINHSAKTFLQAWEDGRVCLHPTDTIPGLTILPKDSATLAILAKVKQRDRLEFISLVASAERAFAFWQPLPPFWQVTLSKVWPAALSVIYTASDATPDALRSPDGTIALRVPQLTPRHMWFADVLQELYLPLPTTSVNTSGQAAALTWADAQRWCRDQSVVFVPDIIEVPLDSSPLHRPSTIIKIKTDGSFDVVRQGAFDAKGIRDVT